MLLSWSPDYHTAALSRALALLAKFPKALLSVPKPQQGVGVPLVGWDNGSILVGGSTYFSTEPHFPSGLAVCFSKRETSPGIPGQHLVFPEPWRQPSGGHEKQLPITLESSHPVQAPHFLTCRPLL